MLHVGIIGLGFMAATHIKAYQQLEGVKLGALCNPSGRHLDGDFSKVTGNVGDNKPLVLEMHGIKATKSVNDLLSDPDIDLIDICAPTVAHRDLAIAALKAGKHVLCEKPLARASTTARQIAAAAETAKGFFMPAMCMRFWPGWAWLKEAIDSARYGRVLAARFRRVAEPPAWGQKNFFNGAESGGGLFDLHIHDTDFVQFCFGRPKSVFSTGYKKFSGAIDHVVTQYEVGSGATVHAEGSWAMVPGFGFSMTYTVNFERATADYDLARSADTLRLCEEGQTPRTIPCPGPDGYVLELKHMIDSIQSGRPPSIVTGRDALSAVEICEAEEKSVTLRQIVTL
ncbi:MAG: Gfo/Idh/MocA family oxidoreductase [Verrucomicrobia subdivision 3 bacterium]|nr:Gfo/Idh/MocA family oxidoreductase [Limisphaerales bacterium]